MTKYYKKITDSFVVALARFLFLILFISFGSVKIHANTVPPLNHSDIENFSAHQNKMFEVSKRFLFPYIIALRHDVVTQLNVATENFEGKDELLQNVNLATSTLSSLGSLRRQTPLADIEVDMALIAAQAGATGWSEVLLQIINFGQNLETCLFDNKVDCLVAVGDQSAESLISILRTYNLATFVIDSYSLQKRINSLQIAEAYLAQSIRAVNAQPISTNLLEYLAQSNTLLDIEYKWYHFLSQKGQYDAEFAIEMMRNIKSLLDMADNIFPDEVNYVVVPDSPSNSRPNRPQISISDRDTLTPTIHVSGFTDPDANDYHLKSWFGIRTENGTDIYSTAWYNASVKSHTLPSGLLNEGTNYTALAVVMDNHGDYSYAAKADFRTITTNLRPATPTLTVSNTQSTKPLLEATDFSDPDGDNHIASWWGIKENGIYIWQTDWESPQTQRQIPNGVLEFGKTYSAAVAYKDSHGSYSFGGFNEFNLSEPTTGITYDIYPLNLSLSHTVIKQRENLNIELRQYCDSEADIDKEVKIAFYISEDNKVSLNDILIDTQVSDICRDSSDHESTSFTIPEDFSIGQFFIIAYADYDKQIDETDETNNEIALPITIEESNNLPEKHDFFFETVSIDAEQVFAGGEIRTYAKVRYNGPDSSDRVDVSLRYYLSEDNQLSSDDVLVGEDTAVPSNEFGSGKRETILIPSTFENQTYYVFFRLNEDQQYQEDNTANNIASHAFEVREITQVDDPTAFKLLVEPGVFEVNAGYSGYVYNFSVDCNSDGIFEFTNIVDSFSCMNSNQSIITMTGQFPRLRFDNKEKILEVIQWGDNQWERLDHFFRDAINLRAVSEISAPDLSKVTSLESMFEGAEKFNSNLNHWDVSNIQNMQELFDGAKQFNGKLDTWDMSRVLTTENMFYLAESFNQPIGNWNFESLTNVRRMFRNAKVFNQNINDWDTSKVTTLEGIFDAALQFNKPLDRWDVSNVLTLESAFEDTTTFNQLLSSWDVSKVTSFKDMFYGALSFNQPLSNWDVSNAQNMRHMFAYTEKFNQELEAWNVSNVTDMSYMFASSQQFNQDLNSWDISKANISSMFLNTLGFNGKIDSWDMSLKTALDSIFQNAISFNQDISQWDTSNILSFRELFYGASSFNQDISQWDTSNATNFTSMFDNAESFNQDISVWNTSKVNSFSRMFRGATSFNQDISLWDYSSSTSIYLFLESVKLDTEYYDSLLNKIVTENPTLGGSVAPRIHGGLSTYSPGGKVARDRLTNEFGWVIQDGGFVNIIDTDGDGIPNDIDTDDDNDGMPDSWEDKYDLNSFDPNDAVLDTDGDGTTNLNEYLRGTNPLVAYSTEVVKRAEIPGPILRAIYGSEYIPPEATGSVFTDIQSDDFNADWIEKLTNDGITEGCSETRFCPDLAVTKEQLAKILLKAKFGSSYTPPAPSGNLFDDVSTDTFAAGWIEGLVNQGITEGCDETNFCPKEGVTIESIEKMLEKALP